jgi:hypothetical protein
MKTLMVGECASHNVFSLSDTDAGLEADFEALTVRALCCLYPTYHCIVFNGSFLHENRVSRPDLALIAGDFSHWFIIEVELSFHSLAGHVLPQVRGLR